MAETIQTERLEVSLTTPAGEVTVPVEISTGLIPITAIVSTLRTVGERAMELEEQRAIAAGGHISCQKGCAACCRMLVPVSPPEAHALYDLIEAFPPDRREAVLRRLEEARRQLNQAGLFEQLSALTETDRQLTDEEMEMINQAYYALRMPCPFLQDEMCSIYQDRPSACRELLVTSPPELCRDLIHNPVRSVPVPLRISTVISLLWSELAGGPVRFIPLPLVRDWARRHASDRNVLWRAAQIFERAVEMAWRFLVREFQQRGVPLPEAKEKVKS